MCISKQTQKYQVCIDGFTCALPHSRYRYYMSSVEKHNINWRDVQTKNVANNVDMSCLRAPWQNGPYKN